MAKDQIKFNVSSESTGDIDREKGIIYGVSVITGDREALGHEFYVDETMIDQVVEQGKEVGETGLKARWDHPNACYRSIGTTVGRFKNFRKDGLQARADLHLLDAAATSPEGNLRTHILDLAEEAPDMFATSIVFSMAEAYTPQLEDYPDKSEEDIFFLPHSRLDTLYACDVVDEGAANDTLFGRPNYLAEQAEKWAGEHSDLIIPIIKKMFLKEGIDFDNLKKTSMKEEKKTALVALKDKLIDAISNHSSEEVESTEEPTEEVELNEVEDTVTLEEVLDTNETLNAVIDEMKNEATAKDATIEELNTANEALKDEFEGLKKEVEGLEATVLGESIETNTDAVVQDPEENKEKTPAEREALRKEEHKNEIAEFVQSKTNY